MKVWRFYRCMRRLGFSRFEALRWALANLYARRQERERLERKELT